MNPQKFFKGKKITVMGLGLLGRGLRDVLFLSKCGALLSVTDLKSRRELAPTLAKLRRLKNIKYTLGGHKREDFRDKDMILKAAGVPLDSPFIKEAHRRKIAVEMDESLFLKLAPREVTVIGVTGTRGKTTVSTLIFEILKQARRKGALGAHKQVFLAGNIKDTATLPLLSKVKSGDIVVAELSSWQLQGFGESGISPKIAVFTNFLDDHLNYYDSDRKKYFRDKSFIYRNQNKGDFLVVSRPVLKKIRARRDRPKSKIIIAKKLPSAFKLKIPGKHNRENASFALAVAKILKVPPLVAHQAIENFSGVAGREQLVRKLKEPNVEIYNDTTSTTPDAVSAALRALGSRRNSVLIMGGADKNLRMQGLIPEIKKYCRAVVFIPGSGTERFKKDLRKAISRRSGIIKNGTLKITETKTLKEALKQAILQAKRGDKIIFSPGFASFGMFRNEFDRGEKFDALVSKL